MNLKRNISFGLKRYGKKGDYYHIRMRITYNNERMDLGSGCDVHSLEAWDSDNQCVRDGFVSPGGVTAASINRILSTMRDDMDTTFKYFELKGIIPTQEQLRLQYNEYSEMPKTPRAAVGPITKQEEPGEQPAPAPLPKKRGRPRKGEERSNPKGPEIWPYLELFQREQGSKNAWTDASYDKFATLTRDLKAFKPHLRFNDLDEQTLTDFLTYLREEKPLQKPRKKNEEGVKLDKYDTKGIRNSSIQMKLNYLKWFLRWATSKGYNTNLSFIEYKPKLKKTQNKPVFLTKEELAKLKNLQLTPEQIALDRVRDVFLFCCYSSLRFSDVYNLKRSDIKGDRIEITTVKTADSLIIELNNTSRAILDKYKDSFFPGNRALPVISNQKMNDHLKDLCKLAGIDEPVRRTFYRGNQRIDEVHFKYELIGTHTARRTFICNSLSLGIPADVVMKWTGHCDYKSMKPYIDIVDSIKAEQMAKLNDL